MLQDLSDYDAHGSLPAYAPRRPNAMREESVHDNLNRSSQQSIHSVERGIRMGEDSESDGKVRVVHRPLHANRRAVQRSRV